MIDTAIEDARIAWGLGDAQIILAAARENQIYKVETPTGPAALRFHRPGYRTRAEIQSEMEWMAMLADRGVTLPEPIAALDGSLTHASGDYVIDMLTWLNGVTVSQVPPSEAIYEKLGRLIGQMQNLARDWTPPKGFTRPTWDLVGEAPSWGRFWDSPVVPDTQRASLEHLRQIALEHIDAKGTDQHILIHADLVLDNVLVDGDTLYPIDFDDGGYGDPLFDLATVTSRSLRFDPKGGLREATIRGYQAACDTDISDLRLFEALRAASYIGWIADRMDLSQSEARLALFLEEVQIRYQALES